MDITRIDNTLTLDVFQREVNYPSAKTRASLGGELSGHFNRILDTPSTPNECQTQ